MKKVVLFKIIVACVGITTSLLAQSDYEAQELKYRRSSLYTILMESEDFPKKDTVIKAYYKAPFPDKYNNHNLGVKSFDPKDYPITNKERISAGIKTVRSKQDSIGSERDADMPLHADKFLKENDIAKKLVAKWFNRQEDGSFNMNLISERGFYNATEMEANIANASIRGTAMLADAGEELIKNTFVIISKLDFVSNEYAALAIKETAYALANEITNMIGQMAVKTTAEILYQSTRKGYSVWTTSRLYRLKWDDSIAAVFYRDYWMNSTNIDVEKKEAFDNTNLFELEFIGEQKAVSLVLLSIGRNEEKIITMATIRNIDKVYYKLQREFDVFKTKIPLYSGHPIIAKIGKKEGLNGREKFEVLEQTFDPKTGKTFYKRKGIIKVNKRLIWDNRYNSSEKNPGQGTIGTTFKGGKKYHAGLLIRQLK